MYEYVCSHVCVYSSMCWAVCMDAHIFTYAPMHGHTFMCIYLHTTVCAGTCVMHVCCYVAHEIPSVGQETT